MSDGQNYIIVNNEAGSAISDGFADIVRYIDARNKGTQPPVAPLASEFKEALGPDASEEAPLPQSTQPLFVKVAESSDALLKAPPSEFEPAFNLLWYVLSSAPDFDALIPLALSKLTETYPSVHAQQLALLAVLGSLFNITSSQSTQKPEIFKQIVNLAVEAQATSQLVSQLPQLAEWLRDWQISSEDKEQLVNKIVCNAGVQHRQQIRDFLTSVVIYLPDLSECANSLVSNVIEDPSAYDFGSLLHLPGIQALKGNSGDLYEALQLIASGDIKAFSQLNSSISEKPLLVKKTKVTAVAKLAANAKSNELSYSDVSSALSISQNEVEALIVDTIKAGLVRGRMNQLQEKFYVESATVIGDVTDHHWDVIESRLATWKKSLKAILDVSHRARSNHDLVKTLSKLEVN